MYSRQPERDPLTVTEPRRDGRQRRQLHGVPDEQRQRWLLRVQLQPAGDAAKRLDDRIRGLDSQHHSGVDRVNDTAGHLGNFGIGGLLHDRNRSNQRRCDDVLWLDAGRLSGRHSDRDTDSRLSTLTDLDPAAHFDATTHCDTDARFDADVHVGATTDFDTTTDFNTDVHVESDGDAEGAQCRGCDDSGDL